MSFHFRNSKESVEREFSFEFHRTTSGSPNSQQRRAINAVERVKRSCHRYLLLGCSPRSVVNDIKHGNALDPAARHYLVFRLFFPEARKETIEIHRTGREGRGRGKAERETERDIER